MADGVLDFFIVNTMNVLYSSTFIILTYLLSRYLLLFFKTIS
jgi:hypothetical protein